MKNEFEKYAHSMGINDGVLSDYKKTVNGMISPTVVEERRLNVATMDVFSRLMMDRKIFLGTAIDGDVANIISAQLMFLESIDPDTDIELWLNTPGGSVSDGLQIYDIMNLIKPDVSTTDMAMAASMGSILLSSGAKGKRYALPHSRVMIHQVSSVAQGQCSDMKIAIAEAEKYQNELYRILSENTGQSFDVICKDADRDHWFTSEEALQYGLIDKVITKR